MGNKIVACIELEVPFGESVRVPMVTELLYEALENGDKITWSFVDQQQADPPPTFVLVRGHSAESLIAKCNEPLGGGYILVHLDIPNSLAIFAMPHAIPQLAGTAYNLVR